MIRITAHDLTLTLARLNAATGIDAPCYTRLGSWFIGQAYGGYQLERVMTDGGGVKTYGGFGTKREVLDRLHAMLDGLALR